MNGVEKLIERKEVVHQLIEILVQKEDNARDRYFSDSSEYHHREDERLNAKIEQIKEAYPKKYEDYFREAKKIANWEHGSVTKSARVEIQPAWDKFQEKMDRQIETEKQIEKLFLQEKAKVFFRELSTRYENEISGNESGYMSEEEYDNMRILSEKEARLAASLGIMLECPSYLQPVISGEKIESRKTMLFSPEYIEAFYGQIEKWQEFGFHSNLSISKEYALLNTDPDKIYEQLLLLEDSFDFQKWEMAMIRQGKWTEKMVQTDHGEIPLGDFREIMAIQYGYDSYKDMNEKGIYIGDDYEGADREAFLKHYQTEQALEKENKFQKEMADQIRQMMKKDYKSFIKALFFVETGVQANKVLEKAYEKHMESGNGTFLNGNIVNSLKKGLIIENTIYVVSDLSEKKAYLNFAKENDMQSIRVYTWEETTRITDHQISCEKIVLALKANESISKEEINELMKQVQAKEYQVHNPISESFEKDWQESKGEHIFYIEDYAPVME